MKKILVILFFAASQLLSQQVDIVPALQQIESGNLKKAEAALKELQSKNPNDPSVLFLDAVLTKDGDQAVEKYETILEKFPQFQYADASLYRIFSYYYSLGYYKKAEEYLTRLKKDFPESPYIKSAARNIPDVDEPSVQKSEPLAPVTKPVPEKTVQQTETKTYGFTIQAGAFLNVDNAKNLCERLNKENYSTEITTKEVGGSILNVVNVGKFISEDDAKPVLSLLEKKYNLKGRVVPINK
ncbi:MAG: SPOR domain-containing protein [Bacteroidetes bacterium]|nr:SPOR domain-containing protein [Bacteroidota bacterium]